MSLSRPKSHTGKFWIIWHFEITLFPMTLEVWKCALKYKQTKHQYKWTKHQYKQTKHQ